MTWGAIGVAAVGAVAGAASSAQGAAAGKDAQRAKYYAAQGAYAKFKTAQDQLLKGTYLGHYGLADVFGDKPEAALYNPIDVNSQLISSALGNQAASPDIASLVGNTNDINRSQDLNRITSLLPQFTNSLDSYSGATNDLINGKLPFEDVLGITSNQAELGASLGTPGTRTNATLKDLGISRMSAEQQGGQQFQQLISSLATGVNPLQSQFLAQGNYLTPQNYLSTNLGQAALQQQSQQSANYLNAAPNPGIANLFNANLQQQQQIAGIQGTASAMPSATSAAGSGAMSGALSGILNYFGGGLSGGFGSSSGLFGGSSGYYSGGSNMTGNITGELASARPY